MPGGRTRGGGPGSGGFTLLELVLVLGALTLVSLVSIRAFFTRSDITLENAARLLANDLRAAQTSAALTRQTMEFVIHPDGGGYHVEHGHDGGEHLRPRRYGEDAVFEDVRVVGIHLAHGSVLRFDERGRPSSAATITLAHGDARLSILVDAEAGCVVVEGER
jgi:type II secretory pathway pseudopilin PulG